MELNFSGAEQKKRIRLVLNESIGKFLFQERR